MVRPKIAANQLYWPSAIKTIFDKIEAENQNLVSVRKKMLWYITHAILEQCYNTCILGRRNNGMEEGRSLKRHRLGYMNKWDVRHQVQCTNMTREETWCIGIRSWLPATEMVLEIYLR